MIDPSWRQRNRGVRQNKHIVTDCALDACSICSILHNLPALGYQLPRTPSRSGRTVSSVSKKQ
jgi:hypothetical protein